jgi:hypothetical protein
LRTELTKKRDKIAHAELLNVTADQHHPKAHAHTASDGSGELDLTPEFGGVVSETSYNQSLASGSAPTSSRSDHTHGSVPTLFRIRRWFSAVVNHAYGGGFGSGNQAYLGTNCGVAFVGGFSVTDHTFMDVPGPFGTICPSVSGADQMGSISVNSAAGTNNGLFSPVHNPTTLFVVKAAPSIADRAFLIGLHSLGTPPTSITAANRVLPSPYAFFLNFVGFRYEAGTGFWYVGSRTGSGAAVWTLLGTAVTPNTLYALEISTFDQGVSWILKINGIVVQTISAANGYPMPVASASSSELYLPFIGCVRTVAGGAANSIKVSHIYGEGSGGNFVS